MHTLSFHLPSLSSPNSPVDEPHFRSFRSWNVRIRDLAGSHGPLQALSTYAQMLLFMGSDPAPHLTLPSVLKACSKLPPPLSEGGRQVHAHVVKHHELIHNVFVSTALVGFYVANGGITEARQVFDEMPKRNVVSWTKMIDGYFQAGDFDMGFSLFRDMQVAGVTPDEFTVVGLLSGCAQTGALELGRWVHVYLERINLGLSSSSFVGTALIDMYCKCGSLGDAVSVFRSMTEKSVETWNAMLHGLAVHGNGKEALELFAEMERYGVRPNRITFIAVLSACSHNGLVHEGRKLFDLMRNKYQIIRDVKHYGCIVDMLGRAGLLEEALEFANEMPIKPNPIVWGSLLSGCKIHGNVEIGEYVTKRLVALEPCDDSHYVMLSSMYAEEGRWEEMARVRMKIGAAGFKKPRGLSWVEVGSEVHEFVSADRSHPRSDEIHSMLRKLIVRLQAYGYEPEISESTKEEDLVLHSEKLAVAFGLLRVESPAPVRVMKNLRICRDCHTFMKMLSEVFGREVVVRDGARFHRFRDGSCSCKDYW